jgi:hypothetical protein
MAAPLRGKRLEDAIEALRAAATSGDIKQVAHLVVKGLRSGNGLLARQAVPVADEFAIEDLREPLESVMQQLLAHPGADPGCVAKEAIARRLLREQDVADALWQAAARHVQIEPTFGKSIDTAGELRGHAATGLAGGHLPDKTHLLIDLLLDPEIAACAGAIRALGGLGTDEALSLIRFRALIPRTEPAVVAECFRALLHPENTRPASLSLPPS